MGRIQRILSGCGLVSVFIFLFSACSLDANDGEPWRILQIYTIGESGPAGGIVFYDKGDWSDDWRYLEAWVEDIEVSVTWGNYDITGATDAAIGTGWTNTRTVVEFYAGTGIAVAADAADGFAVGGYDDWFLPSLDELQEMYAQREVLAGVQDVFSWSSTEVDSDNVYTVNLSNGQAPATDKLTPNSVRPIRAF